MIDDAQLVEMLRRWPVARLATSNAAGMPHVVPIVFCLHQDTIYSPIDGKPKASTRLRRLRNLEDNPSASLLLDHYDSDWQRLWWVRLDAVGDALQPDAQTTEQLEEALHAKYPQYLTTAMFKAEPLFIRLRWHRVSAWAPEGFEEVLARLPETLPPDSG
jgi:PPOX class probable F420-dependent enzyme